MDENLSSSLVSRYGLLNKLSFWVLLVVTALVPVFFLPFSFVTVQFGTSLIFSLGVIISSILYIVSGIAKGTLDLPRPAKYPLGVLILVPFVYFLAGIANGFSRVAFFGYTFDIYAVGFIFLAFSYLFLVSVHFSKKNSVFYGYLAFVLSSIVLALFLVSRLIFGKDFLSFGIFQELTANPVGTFNNLGIFFGAGALLSLFTYEMVDVKKLIKVLLTVSLVLSLFFLALVNFSVIWMILTICSFLFILYSVFSGVSFGQTTFVEKLKSAPRYSTAVFVIALIFSIWGTNIGSYLSTKLGVVNIEVRPDLTTTLEIARNTLRDEPLFGSGPNTFVNQWLMYKPNEIVSSIFWNTDFQSGVGLIPTFLVTTGIIGVISWLLFFIYYIYLGFKSIFTRVDDPFTKYLLVSSFFVSLYLWIMTFVYVPSAVVFVITLFFTGLFFASVYLSNVISLQNRQFNLNPKVGFLSSIIMVSSLVVVVSLGYGLFKSSLSLWYFQKSSYALNTSKDSKTSEEYMLKAIVAVPHDIYYRALSEIRLFKLNEVLAQDPKKVKQEDIQKQFSDGLTSAITAGLSATESDKTNYLNWVSLGRVYDAVSIPQINIDRAYESAQFAYLEALKRNPKNPGIFMLLARLSATRNDLPQAENYAKQAIEIKNNYLDAYFLLSQIEVANNNIRGAIQSVTSASVIEPTNPAIFFQLGLLKYNISDFDGAIPAFEKAISMAPDYANAKFFLGLSYEATKQREKALKQFEELKVTNPDNKEVETILSNLKSGKSIFTNTTNAKPEKGKTLPINER